MKISEYIRRKCIDNERGSAMLAVMVTLVALTVIGIAATRTSTFESASSGNQKRKQAAFYAAEAGLEHGKAVLMDKIEKEQGGKLPDGGWDFVLGGATGRNYKDGVSLVSNNSFFDGKYKYTVKVWNNKEDVSPAGDENTDDNDAIIIIRSQAEGKNGAEFAAVEVSMGAVFGDGTPWIPQDQTGQDFGGANKNSANNDKKAVATTAADGSTNFQL